MRAPSGQMGLAGFE